MDDDGNQALQVSRVTLQPRAEICLVEMRIQLSGAMRHIGASTRGTMRTVMYSIPGWDLKFATNE
jgi:hypothetical protein